MNLSLKVDGAQAVTDALQTMRAGTARKAVRTWANWVGIEAQAEMRKTIPTRFSFRGTADGFRQAIVFNQAVLRGNAELQAKLSVGASTSRTSRTAKLGAILARHEEAETRTRSADNGLQDLVRTSRGRMVQGGYFIPANNLRTPSANPPKGLYPRAIGVQMRQDKAGKLTFAKSTKGRGASKVSYFATEKGIFRRLATRAVGQRAVQAIWWFTRRVRSTPRLGLWDTASQTFQERAVALGLQAVEETLFREWLARSGRR